MKQHLFFLLSVLLFAACSTSRNSRSSSSVLTPRAVTSSTSGTGDIQLDYVQQYKNVALSEMQRAGIPASITLAQGILESASGRSELASNANNHFGIKCAGDWTGKTFYKKDDDRGADGQLIESCFRKYNDPQESFFDHSEFLRDPRKSNRYGFLFNLDKRDYKSWARGLQSSGYATSQIYADQLIDLIERLRLFEYDQPGVVDIKPGEIIPESVPPQNRIGRVNDVKVVNTRPGETVADIARIYNLQADKVADYNDRAYTPAEYVPPGSRIFIQKKQKSWHGQATHHFVKEGQTMLEISQLYGIRLDNLLKCNNMQPGQEPAADEKIRLRGKRSSNETVHLRDAASTPKPTTQPSGPVTMTPDDDVLFEDKPQTPTTKPSDPVFTGKPATTGVPLPPDPVPANPNPPTPTTQPQPQPNTPTPQPAPTTQQPVPSGYHLVVKGDTLYNISKRYSTTVAKLKELNNLRSDYIQIGQTLRVR
ncbi:MAG: LysM peptidoglycan-binding domain-containing protein [Lewinellaceae bacterium]|nr:LysM peptidoglycan-binding domain-containing protein [Saprospiraceae bacterium]MCB9330206.1 LysM peptidoglycan-binding domain-containing protein [Lewinellaceae bacterium]